MMLGAALKEKVCTSGLPVPAGSGTWRSRWLTASRSSLVLESTLNWTWTCEKLWLEVAKRCRAGGSRFSALESGVLMARWMPAGFATGSPVKMKTLGKSMEGRSSWLSRKMLKIPAPMKRTAKRMTTGRLPRHQAMMRLKSVLLFSSPARPPSLGHEPPRSGHKRQIEETRHILHFRIDTGLQRASDPSEGFHEHLATPTARLAHAPGGDRPAVDDDGWVNPPTAALQAALQP